MIKLTKLALSALVATGMMTTTAKAQDVLVYLTSGSTQTQGMAMVLSGQMLQQKAKVHLLLCDEAGDLALTASDSEPLKPMNKSPAELLDNLMQQGVTVEVCALYLPNKNSEVTLKPGIQAAKPPVIAAKLLNSDVKTFSF